jgi:hypothetical protein
MNYTTASSWGPEKTPSLIKQMIIITCVIAILSAGVQTIFDQFNLFPGPQNFLSLSWWGLQKGYVWQPLTFLFIQEAPAGLSFFFFITLLFNIYLLWVIGSSIVQILGRGPFLRLYFLGGILAASVGLFFMKITGQHEMLMGMTPSFLILFTIWSMAYPEREILLFFILPIQVKWLVVALVSILLLITLSHWELPYFFMYLSAVVIGYCYAVMMHSWYSPFHFTQKFDMRLSRTANQVRQRLPSLSFKKKKEKDVKTVNPKIIDISSSIDIKDDDAFVDAMLSKISRRGEESLSWHEKKRLKEISERKMREDQ